MFDSLAGQLAHLDVLWRVALALLLGGLVGAEREIAAKPAGLRTHMLVSAAAALLVGLSEILVSQLSNDVPAAFVRTDPIRVLEAVITGVSFLGAGTIIRQRKEGMVSGLTTAASLLLTAAIGVAVALNAVLLAVGATLLAVATLRLVRYFEKRLRAEG